MLCVPLYRVAPGAGNTHFATAFLTGHSFGTVGAYANPHRQIVSITNRGPCEREGVHSLTAMSDRTLARLINNDGDQLSVSPRAQSSFAFAANDA